MERPAARASGDITEALEALPLFPLHDLVLLPGALLPLHIFEPRYRRLVRDALDGHQVIGVVNVPDPARLDDRGMPRLASVAGVGTIVDHAELPSGRFNILLRGRARVTLEELPFVAPYRRARATVIPSTAEDVTSSATAGLIAAATGFVTLVRARDASFDFRMAKLTDAGSLADHCAQHLLIDGRDRQTALETASVADRVRFVTETLALQRLTLSGSPSTVN